MLSLITQLTLKIWFGTSDIFVFSAVNNQTYNASSTVGVGAVAHNGTCQTGHLSSTHSLVVARALSPFLSLFLSLSLPSFSSFPLSPSLSHYPLHPLARVRALSFLLTPFACNMSFA